jgi:uncharacterized damage-inducible protein DinB
MPTIPELRTAAQIFERNESMLAKAITGLTAEQWTARPAGAGNSALWILGHMVWARSRTLKLLGVAWEKPWLHHFERGSKPEDSALYPSSEEILIAWQGLSASLPPALEAAPSEAMAAAAPEPSPSFDGTVGGMVSFLAMHESYHVGQVVYLRRLIGRD